MFDALTSFFREVAREAGCAERLPCWDKGGRSRAPEQVQEAGYRVAQIAARDLSDISIDAYRNLGVDPALSLSLIRV